MRLSLQTAKFLSFLVFFLSFLSLSVYAQDDWGGEGTDLIGSTDAFDAVEEEPSYYVGSYEFFDILGEWTSNNPRPRIPRMNVKSTIVKTYRAEPYFILKGKEFKYPDKVSLKLSEEKLAYVADIAGSECIVMPMRIHGQEKLKVYSFKLDATGAYTEMAVDMMTKGTLAKSSQSSKADVNSFDPSKMVGYWKNEWRENEIIPRFQMYSKSSSGSLYVKPYWIKEDKARLLDEVRLTFDPNDLSFTGTFFEGGIQNKMIYRAIRPDGYNIDGVDLIVEQSYGDGTPVKVFRQFFKVDPKAVEIATAEKLGKSVEGKWQNFDAASATMELSIQEGELEIWIACKDKVKCLLGTQSLDLADDGTLKASMDGWFYDRDVSIDVDLNANHSNGSLIERPAFLVVNTTVKKKGDEGETRMFSEVFKRKSLSSTIVTSGKKDSKWKSNGITNTSKPAGGSKGWGKKN